MIVHRHLSTLPRLQGAVLTIGTFDGIHLGHRRLVQAVEEEAARSGGPSVLLTFHPHPRTVLQPGRALPQLHTLEEKMEILEQTTLQHLVVLPFTADLASLTAEAYIKELLVDRFRPQVLVIGYDHHFGKGRTGNVALLQERAAHYGYRVVRVAEELVDGIPVSSTRIRQALSNGRPEEAARLLGYPYFFSGNVVHGDALGRQLGYPTANLQIGQESKLLPAEGVYAVRAEVGGKKLQGLLSIGDRPTLDKRGLKVEVFLFDFSGDLYGQQMKVHLLHFIRPQEKFNSLGALMDQMKNDEQRGRQLLG